MLAVGDMIIYRISFLYVQHGTIWDVISYAIIQIDVLQVSGCAMASMIVMIIQMRILNIATKA